MRSGVARPPNESRSGRLLLPLCMYRYLVLLNALGGLRVRQGREPLLQRLHGPLKRLQQQLLLLQKQLLLQEPLC